MFHVYISNVLIHVMLTFLTQVMAEKYSQEAKIFLWKVNPCDNGTILLSLPVKRSREPFSLSRLSIALLYIYRERLFFPYFPLYNSQ